MSTKSLDRWLLIDYAGYPFAPNSLMPDNGLANLAGALLQRGKEVQILDYGTVSAMERFSTPETAARLRAVWRVLQGSADGGAVSGLRRLAALGSLHRAAGERRRRQRRAVAQFADEIIAAARRRGVQALGFKLWSGDGLEGAAEMAARVRRALPGVRIFGGGPQVDVFMDKLFGYCDGFDALAYGEAEETIQHLAENGGDPSAYEAVPNLLFRRDGQVRQTAARIVADLDDLPLPVYDPEIYPSMRGDEKIRIIVVDDSRGCRNHCAFCFHPVKSSHRLRVKSIPRLMREVDSFERGLGIRTFRFAGSCTPYSLLNGFAAEVRRTGRKLAYTSFAHVRGIAEADLQALRQSGCLALFFGIESGSQRILDLMRKGVHTEMIAEALRKAKEAGIFTVGSLIYPAPGETEATAAESLALLARERPDALSIQAPIVIPRTDWCEHPEAYGIAFRNRDHYLAAGLRWKLNLLLPPMFWQDLPVRIDGRTYKQVLRETGRLVREAERLGFVTGASDDLYLMSVRSGMDLPAFRDASRPAFFAGDTPAVRALVPRINASV